MTRVAASSCIVWLLLLCAPDAHAEPCDCLVAYDSPCARACDVRPPPDPSNIAELRGVQAAAIATGIASWIFTTVLASQQEHFYLPVDTIPVVGGINSAVHNQSRDTPLMLFASSAQVMSILVAVVAGLELAEEHRRWELSVGCSGNSAGLMLGGRF